MYKAFPLLYFLMIGFYIYSKFRKYYHRPVFTTIPDTLTLIDDIRVPYCVRQQLDAFSHWNIPYFREKYGDTEIYVLHSPNSQCSVKDAKVLKMPLREYIETYITGDHPDKQNYYFKSEDTYQFLRSVGLESSIADHFKAKLPSHTNFYTSFWMGPAGSTTTFHYDTDYTNFLCVLEGRKRIFLLSPQASHRMQSIKTKYGDYWGEFDLSNNERIAEMKKAGELCEIIVGAGDILNIPHHVWHAVINLENTVSFTFHYETIESMCFGLFCDGPVTKIVNLFSKM